MHKYTEAACESSRHLENPDPANKLNSHAMMSHHHYAKSQAATSKCVSQSLNDVKFTF